MTEVRNILLVGETDNGRSSFANALLNHNNSFEEKFKAIPSSVSITEKLQIEEVEIDNINYRIIDTVGLKQTYSSETTISSFRTSH